MSLKILKKGKSILGMNDRNLEFIRPNNFKKAIKIADNKIASKKLLEKYNIPTVETFLTIKSRKDIYKLNWEKLPDSFVIKPNLGFGGGGILVIYGKKKNGKWIAPENKEITEADMLNHILNILDGNFSMHNTPDIAFFEQRIKIHPLLKPYCYKGIPDVRVIVYNRVPVMAMLRIPTKQSGSIANLASGGIGVGIDINKGITTHAIAKGNLLMEEALEKHPDNNYPIRGIKIPNWSEILKISSRAQKVSGLGFCGVDIVIDKENGPIVLEINARPGLSIQNANQAGLKERLNRLKGLKIPTADKGIKIAKELFSTDIEREVEEITGKTIIGTVESITIYGIDKKKTEIDAKIDTGASLTSISTGLANKLGFEQTIEDFKSIEFLPIPARDEAKEYEKKYFPPIVEQYQSIEDLTIIYSSHGTSIRPIVEVKIKLAGQIINSRATIIDREQLKHRIIIGKKDLKPFLIDPKK